MIQTLHRLGRIGIEGNRPSRWRIWDPVFHRAHFDKGAGTVYRLDFHDLTYRRFFTLEATYGQAGGGAPEHLFWHYEWKAHDQLGDHYTQAHDSDSFDVYEMLAKAKLGK